MCTVLQQHLNRQNGIVPDEDGATDDYTTVSVSPNPAGGRAESVALTPAIGGVSSYWVRRSTLVRDFKNFNVGMSKKYYFKL